MSDLPLLTNPKDVLERYRAALANDQIRQEFSHGTAADGRWLADGLGVIGGSVKYPKDCPASVMPRWLAEKMDEFFHEQKGEDAKEWGLRFYEALSDVQGKVPIAAVHYWQAHTVCPFSIEEAQRFGRNPEPHRVLQALHLRALAGEKIDAKEWRPVLKFAGAYANDEAGFAAYKILADGMIDAIKATGGDHA